MGEMLAEFQIRGTAPDSSERSKRDFTMGASSSLHSWSMTGLILSGPAAFFGLRFFRRFTIPDSEILISGIRGVEFLWSSGKSSGLMTRPCTFMRKKLF